MSRPFVVGLTALLTIGGSAAAYMWMRPPQPAVRPAATAETPPLPPSVLSGRGGVKAGANAADAPETKTRGERGAAGIAGETPRAPGPDASAAIEPALGTLHFESDVPGVEVFIDRKLAGVAPLTVPNVKPGPHRLNLSVPGYEPVSESIEVMAGPRDFVFKFREVKLDAQVAVVHKHRLGSCRGTLIATQHGLRYETDNAGDRFTAPLTDVAPLQIDYLDNRLTIAVGGKRYEFSDPEGNADHLFVFHRDVEKARARLQQGDPPAPD
jgi:hypothetical protein